MGSQHNERTTAIFVTRPSVQPMSLAERLDALFLQWAWHADFGEWDSAVRALACALRGLEASGLVHRQRLRDFDGRVVHLVRLTELGQLALGLLAGDEPEVWS